MSTSQQQQGKVAAAADAANTATPADRILAQKCKREKCKRDILYSASEESVGFETSISATTT